MGPEHTVVMAECTVVNAPSIAPVMATVVGVMAIRVAMVMAAAMSITGGMGSRYSRAGRSACRAARVSWRNTRAGSCCSRRRCCARGRASICAAGGVGSWWSCNRRTGSCRSSRCAGGCSSSSRIATTRLKVRCSKGRRCLIGIPGLLKFDRGTRGNVHCCCKKCAILHPAGNLNRWRPHKPIDIGVLAVVLDSGIFGKDRGMIGALFHPETLAYKIWLCDFPSQSHLVIRMGGDSSR